MALRPAAATHIVSITQLMSVPESQIEVEASQWLSRLEGPVDQATLDELERWGAQSPEHRHAFVDLLAVEELFLSA
jgi:ferric-dicitrate binding protein FerR (iron transport regulator)